MSKKIMPLLFLLASIGITYAVKGKNNATTTHKKKEHSLHNSKKEGSTVEEKAIYSLLMPMPTLVTILKFELLGIAMMVVHFYIHTYKRIAFSIMGTICLITALLEANSYQPSITKENNKEDGNVSYDILMAKLIRFVMSIGFEMLGAAAFLAGYWGIKGIREKINLLAANVSASVLTLIGITIFLAPPSIIYFFFLRPQKKEKEEKTKIAK